MTAAAASPLPVVTRPAKIAIIGGNARSLVANRSDLIRELLARGHEVVALVPGYDIADHRDDIFIDYHEIPLRRVGLNPIHDLYALYRIYVLLRKIKPDILFSYNIKPVLYGSICARLARVPSIYSMITGVGYAFTGKTARQRVAHALAKALYRSAVRFNRKIFFQNPDDLALFVEAGLLKDRHKAVLVNGSGVNLERFAVAPVVIDPVRFLLVARLLGYKGVREFCRAAKVLSDRHPDLRFQVLGGYDPNLPHALKRSELEAWRREGVVEFLGFHRDVRPFVAKASVFVLPSYHEGTPRGVLEAMAMGRAIITTDAPGCRETVVDGVNGFLVPVKDVGALAEAMERFVLHPELIATMGREARAVAEEKYDVRKVNRRVVTTLLEEETDGPQ